MARTSLQTWEIDLRRWAVETAGGDVEGAQRLLSFVLGLSDRTPMEKITDALAEAGIN